MRLKRKKQKMSELYFAYPAILTTRKDTDDILVEFPDLEIEPFAVPESKRSELYDIVWDNCARHVQELMILGKTPPQGTRLEDLPLTDSHDRDAMLVELRS